MSAPFPDRRRMDNKEFSARHALDLLANIVKTGKGAEELSNQNPAVTTIVFALGELMGLRAWQQQMKTNISAVYSATLRKELAMLPPHYYASLYGSVFNDLDAANMEIARLRRMVNGNVSKNQE